MKIILLVLLSINIAFSCTLCKADIPNIQVDINAKQNKEQTIFNISWTFNKEFTNNLKIYDENKNYLFDKNEIENIKNVLEDYTKKINYVTDIKLIYRSLAFANIKPLKIEKLDNSNAHFNEENQLVYNYQFTQDLLLKSNHKMEINFLDKGKNFNFYINKVLIKNNDESTIKINQQNTKIYFYTDVVEENTQDQKESPTTEDDDGIYKYLESQLKELKESIQDLLKDIKETHSLSSYGWLLLFSFAYGILHAIGPGHGKSLVSAYFLGNDKSVAKAINVSILIGVVHTFSAFIITFAIFYSLNTFLSGQLNDIESIAIKISAVIIIAIALYLIVRKIKAAREIKKSIWSTHQQSCACSGCKTESSDIGVILAAGIVPCPGTVTIFIFTLSLGLYYVGFLSALFMSMGMSLIIFITAYLSKNIRDKANENTILIKLFEYGSLVFILLLGLFLLLVA